MLLVQKFGGSSVANVERIRACAMRCLAAQRQGHRVVVVVSAMKGETDRLIRLANELVAPTTASVVAGHYVEPAQRSAAHDRELDQLVATGEVVSASLLAMAIEARGGRSISLTAHQFGMRTDADHTRARIRDIDVERIVEELDAGRIVVCAGFQGLGPAGDVTTLGRGGSDTSAVALAAALDADVCEILTDVEGVYTTDPRLVGRAAKVDRISYEEMLELAGLGAKVLQIRSVAFAKKYGVRVHVRSSLVDTEGTWIVAAEEFDMEAMEVRGIALELGEAKVTLVDVPDVPGVIASVFGALGRAGIAVDMIIQNASRAQRTDITFTLPLGQVDPAVALLGDLPMGGERVGIEVDRDIAKLSIVGLGLRSHADIAARAFAALADAGVNVQMVSNSELRMSIVVETDAGERALAVLHEAFELGADPEP